MPYIAAIRSDIPEGTLQFLDLQPNDSQRNYIYDPEAQAKYARRADNDTVLTQGTGPITTVAEYRGVAAYLIDHVDDDDNGGVALTAAFANTIAAALIARVDSGLAMTLADVDGVIQATTGAASTGLEANNSTGSLSDLLEVLTGAVYVLPAGSQVEDGTNTFDTTVRGSITASRHIYSTGSFNISRNVGKLSELTDAAFTYGGTAGAAVVLYADDGSLL